MHDASAPFLLGLLDLGTPQGLLLIDQDAHLGIDHVPDDWQTGASIGAYGSSDWGNDRRWNA